MINLFPSCGKMDRVADCKPSEQTSKSVRDLTRLVPVPHAHCVNSVKLLLSQLPVPHLEPALNISSQEPLFEDSG